MTSGDTGTGGPDGDGTCGADGLVQSKRVVRLTFNQQLNTIGQLFGGALAEQLATDLAIQDDTSRTFPPLANPREGSIVTDDQFRTGDLAGEPHTVEARVHDDAGEDLVRYREGGEFGRDNWARSQQSVTWTLTSTGSAPAP